MKQVIVRWLCIQKHVIGKLHFSVVAVIEISISNLKGIFFILDKNLHHRDLNAYAIMFDTYILNVFNLVLVGFWITNAFDTWLAIYIERESAADDEMCIYCLGVNNYFSYFSFYIFVTINFTNVALKENFHSLVKYGKYTFKRLKCLVIIS